VDVKHYRRITHGFWLLASVGRLHGVPAQGLTRYRHWTALRTTSSFALRPKRIANMHIRHGTTGPPPAIFKRNSMPRSDKRMRRHYSKPQTRIEKREKQIKRPRRGTTIEKWLRSSEIQTMGRMRAMSPVVDGNHIYDL
jgi:hypothetical protein